MKTACYIYQFLFFLIPSILFSQQGKILLVFEGDTTEYSIVHESGPHPPGGISVKVDSGYVAIDNQLINDKYDGYKITFTNHTSQPINRFYLATDGSVRGIDHIWNNGNGVTIPDLGINEDTQVSTSIDIIIEPGIEPDSSYIFEYDVDYGNPAEFTGGFYVDGELYKTTLTDSCKVRFETSHIIEWTPNTEPDLDGYKIYIGSAPGAYDKTYQTFGKEETEFDITFLGNGVFYAMLTAFDTSGNESINNPIYRLHIINDILILKKEGT